MQIQAQAKINWTLDVVGVREDGYHLLDGIMQPLSLHDTLRLEPADELRLTIEGAPALAAQEDNLVLRAARALQSCAGRSPGARITLQKRIPMGAGLGGGSADCAAALKGLNALWQLGLPLDALLRLGGQLGADVPFCLVNAPCRAQGIGEKLTPLRSARSFPLVLIQPCEALSTREVFDSYHRRTIQKPDTARAVEAFLRGDLAALARFGGNVLEGASIPLRPPIADAKAALLRCGAVLARMTGSGSVVFGAFEDQAAARLAYQALRGQYPVCILTETA